MIYLKKIILPSFTFLYLFIIASTANAQGIGIKKDSIAVIKTMDAFVHAFNFLEWEKFIAFFDKDATAFFPPSAHTPARANNKMEIETIFKKVFENAKAQQTAPPYLHIEPKDLKIQLAGDIAIVSFHLDDPDLFGRRTIVLQKKKNEWLIIHLHASGIVIPK